MHTATSPISAWRWPLLALLALAIALTGPAPAQAQPGASESTPAPPAEDYDIGNRDWNGLNTLTAIARGLGLRVQSTDRIDWEELGAEDIVFMLYPEARLDPGKVVSFVRNGGHLLIADDFGDSIEVLGRLGMLRTPAGDLATTRFYRELDFAPVAEPQLPNHPLAAKVDELVTNVPGVFEQVHGVDSVFGFGPNATVVATGSLGRGRFVVVSDASIFINRMLQFPGNLQFTINTISYLSRSDRTNRLVLLAREFNLTGEPVALFPSGSVQDTVSGMTIDINRLLDEGNDYLLTGWALRVLAVLLAALIAAMAVWVVPSIRKGALDGAWTRAAVTDPIDSYDQLVNRYDQADAKENFVLPAAVLRDNLDQRLSRILRHSSPLTGQAKDKLLDAARSQLGDDFAARLAQIHPTLESLPVRHQAASPVATRYVSKRDFELLHREVAMLDQMLDQSPHSS